MISTLAIDGLRGFDHFTLSDLARINLLVGENNCGKTTVLESLQMLSARGDLSAILGVLSSRDERLWNVESGRRRSSLDIRRLFYGHSLEFGTRLIVAATSDAGDEQFAASVVEPNRQGKLLFDDDYSSPDYAETIGRSLPVAVRFEWHGPVELDAEFDIDSAGGASFDEFRRVLRLESSRPCRMISTSSLSPEVVASLFDKVVLTEEEPFVVDALRVIEPTIERIATVNSESLRTGSPRGGILVKCKGVNDRIPIGSMGDGTWRMLGLALALVNTRNGLLLVDEIDTGLHFTALSKLWHLVDETSKRLNVQVFATTHSRDCYESLATICMSERGEDEVSIQRIERGEPFAVRYGEDEIIAAAERGLEVR